MNLLLTSSGISSRKIGEALQQMVGKSASDCKVGFIPTAINVEPYNKCGVVAQMISSQEYEFYQIDIDG